MATPSIRSPHVRPPAIRWNNGDTLPPVDSTGVAAPLLVDSTTGRLLVDSLNATTADLSGIQAGVAVCEANLATIASDLTAPLKTGDASGTGITSTNVGGKQGLDVNIIAGGGGGGGGGTSAQYNTTLPTYNNGDPATLQTDVNGRLITTGGLTDTQLRATAVPVSLSSAPLPTGAATSSNQTTANTSLASIATNTGNIPALVSGRVPVDGSGVTQPVSLASVPSHPVTNAGTFAVQPSAGDLTSGNAKTQIVQGSNTLAIDSAGRPTISNYGLGSTSYTITTTGATASWTIPAGTNQIILVTGPGGTTFQFAVQFSTDGGTTWNGLQYVLKSGTNGNPPATNVNFSGQGVFAVDAAGLAGYLIRANFTAGTFSNMPLTLVATTNQSSWFQTTQPIGVNVGTLPSISGTVTAVAPTSTTVNQTTGTAATGTATSVTLTGGTPTKFLTIQNTAANGTLYVGFGAATNCTTASFALAAGQGYEFPITPTATLYLLGSTASVTYSILSA